MNYDRSIPYYDSDGDNLAQTVVARSGKIHGFDISGIDAVDSYVAFYDADAADVTPGTTTPDYLILIPKGDGTNYGGATDNLTTPMHFNTSITYACFQADLSTDPTTGLRVSIRYT